MVPMCATIVGSESQLMIFAEPESAVVQPRPTPAISEVDPSTATNTAKPAPAVLTNDRIGDAGSRPAAAASSRSWIIQIQTMKGSATPAVALIATASAISPIPNRCLRSRASAMPAAMRPTMSISL
ncbi:hypothetical protein D9M68_900190 [compost metagenome]